MNIDLSQFGLVGAFQVHDAPTFLAFDERAHQVIRQAQSHSEKVLKHFSARCSRWEVVSDNGERGTLVNLPQSEVLVLVSPQNQIHAGGLYGLVEVVDRLVGPGGCPWDIEQTHRTLTKYLLEESYELIEAIEAEDEEAMKEELGDVLLQPLMHTQKKKLEGKWDIDSVCHVITEKLIRRHPHVFGDVDAKDSQEVLRNWDAIKKQEKREKQVSESILSGVPGSMPALLKAQEVSKRAARAGFEWKDIDGVWEKVQEEETELRESIFRGEKGEIESELGDYLFTLVNIARWSGVDAESALRRMVQRFTLRFQKMEEISAKPMTELSFEEWDELWNRSKQITSETN